VAATRRDIEFKTDNGITLRGWLRLPAGAGPYPLVILAHGHGCLKDWPNIPDVADGLIADGIAAMAFDYRNWGDSDGAPRDEVDHPGQVADWRNAITFALTLEEIDSARIGVWGTSLGGRNVLIVGGLDHRIRCVLAQVPAIDWADIVMHHQNNAGQREELLAAIDEERLNRFLGKQPRYERKAQLPGTETAKWIATLTDEQVKKWSGQTSLMSYEPTVASNALPFVDQISPTPLCMVVVDKDVVAPLPAQLNAYNKALEPKRLVVLPGKHFDIYSSPLKERAAAVAREWFGEYLKGA
jgi:uncharacterized protein